MTLAFRARLERPSGFVLDASFEVDGGITALFGPSGSGKTTVLELIAGLCRASSGRIELDGDVLVDTAAGRFVPPERRAVGYAFQDALLFPHLDARANLAYGERRGGAHGVAFDRVVELLELGPLLDRRPQQLSGGQRQRLSLGRALLRGPRLLLMDEPLVGLEEALRDRILADLERVTLEWRIPTLFVSHDQVAVRRLADRVVVVEDGRVIDAGPTNEKLDHAVITSLRSHPGPVNLVELDEVRSAGDRTLGRIGAQELVLPKEARDASYVRFLASDVTLARHDVTGLSMRNQLRGRVRKVVTPPDEGRTWVAVDVGRDLWAELTPDATAELELAPGVEVVCLIKTRAIRPVS